jgi:hypothetical protein
LILYFILSSSLAIFGALYVDLVFINFFLFGEGDELNEPIIEVANLFIIPIFFYFSRSLSYALTLLGDDSELLGSELDEQQSLFKDSLIVFKILHFE